MSTAPLIAVTGATGQLGGRVARRLADRGVPQRLVVRDAARAPALTGAEVALGEYGDGGAFREALDGIETLYLVSAGEHPDRVALHRAAVDDAVQAGVSRLVYVSFLGAAPDCAFTFGRDHWHTEQHIRASGVRFTFLRDNIYLDFLPKMVGREGVIRAPAGQGRLGAVARDDIADAGVAVLLSGGEHDGRSYELTGPESLSLAEAAEQLSQSAGRPVRYQEETLEEAYASRSGFGAPSWEVAGWVTSYVAIAAGELDVVTDAVQKLAGHPPIDLREYLRRDPTALAHVAG